MMNKQTNMKMLCVSLQFANEPKNDFTISNVNNLARGISNFYLKNSRGLLKIIYKTNLIKVPFVGAPKNVNRAEQYVINNNPDYDIYAIMTKYNGDTDNAGNRIAHLSSPLVRTGCHEVGHLLGLGHAGSYVYNKNKYELDYYGDGLSVMSKYPSNFLTGPQYYYLNWTPTNEVMIIKDKTSLPTTVTLKRLNIYDLDGLSTLIIKSNIFRKDEKSGRDLFITYPQPNKFFDKKPYIAMHLQNDGGSQKIKTFTKSYLDKFFTNIKVTILKSSFEYITIQIEFLGLLSNQKIIAESKAPEVLEEPVSEVLEEPVSEEVLEECVGNIEIDTTSNNDINP